eukprot:TRINITY_DN960_c0_g1_i1.p5 TRINITY_DN960_c0_g1~~TRINITY_DN960_c0_g1_i1.p5  ORF type:complete len:106 (+),score=5.27 TRINITY_DN960_c0_g1_i1:1278-1595(+)
MSEFYGLLVTIDFHVGLEVSFYFSKKIVFVLPFFFLNVSYQEREYTILAILYIFFDLQLYQYRGGIDPMSQGNRSLGLFITSEAACKRKTMVIMYCACVCVFLEI